MLASVKCRGAFLDGKGMARAFLAEAGPCRPLDFCAHACARLHIFIPVFYCKLYIGEVIGLCCNKLAVYSPSTKLYTNCSPALSPQMSAASRTLPGGMFRCSRVASSGRDGRWCFLGEGGRTGRAVFVCFPVAKSGRAGGRKRGCAWSELRGKWLELQVTSPLPGSTPLPAFTFCGVF